MDTAAGYGVSVSYREQVILIGGSNAREHLSRVIGYEWDGSALVQHQYPSLPFSLANMSGTVLDDLLILVGGNVSPTGPGLNKCLVLDLQDIESGWAEMEAWPGPGRIFPVCATFDGAFYMFSGEATAVNSKGNSYRLIHQDGYRLSIQHLAARRSAHWAKLAAMPRGMSAGGAVLPVIKGDRFLFWGGVDAVTAQYKDTVLAPRDYQRSVVLLPRYRFLGVCGSAAAYSGPCYAAGGALAKPVVLYKRGDQARYQNSGYYRGLLTAY